jgi:integrase
LRRVTDASKIDPAHSRQVVSERLGHSSVRVTAEVYAHSLRGQDDEAVRKLEDFVRASRSAA